MPVERLDHGSDDNGLLDLVIPSPPPFSDIHSVAAPIPDEEEMLDVDIPSPPPMPTSTDFDADYDEDSLLNVCIPTPPPHPEEDVEMHHSGEDADHSDGEQKDHSAGSHKEQKKKATDVENDVGLWALNADERRRAIRKLEKHLTKGKSASALLLVAYPLSLSDGPPLQMNIPRLMKCASYWPEKVLTCMVLNHLVSDQRPTLRNIHFDGTHH
jgi:hypothetical protein